MTFRARMLVPVAICLFAFSLPTHADPATYSVTRASILREGPSSATTRVRHLDPGETLEARRDSVVSGYRLVSADASEAGWVWTKNIETVTEEDAVPPATSPAPTAASTISPTWKKPAPNHTTFTCA